ncbi:hypothetical protein H5V45_18490 [Nocardioides sp. KIGAM211]|uniref:DUF3558 domain-containing protein n=1 Tax=Nocardioides luti TaxID=2761101 RepID=A0A7X0VCR7_9ACTN|nr:hypothetical protein [Nocardioides luti]MBB6629322.1 hypothetical protein [Nocardioides luti]
MGTSRAVLATVALAVALLAGACTSGSPPSAAPPPSPYDGGPTGPVVPALREPDAGSPDAGSPGTTHVELCPWLGRERPDRTVSLVLPDRFAVQVAARRTCTFRTARLGGAAPRPAPTTPTTNEVVVTVGVARSLADFRDRVLAPRAGTGTRDDAVTGIDYTADVGFFADDDGERLAWSTRVGGRPVDVVALQAGGVRIQWQAGAGRLDDQRDEVTAAVASLGVLDGTTDLCSARTQGALVTVRSLVPEGARATTSYAGSCTLRLAPSVPRSHTASLDLRPARSLAQERALLPRGSRVLASRTGVPGLGAGGRVERLEYSTPGSTPLHVTVVQQGGVRLTWRATPTQWADERTAFEDLRATLRVTRTR